MKVDVVVPTYRRPEHLERCLAAIAGQTQPAAHVLVVARGDDSNSHEVVHAAAERCPSVQLVTVDEPGVIAAMSAGVAATTAPVVAFTDDDAAPHPDWLARMLPHFEDPTVSAVGGRDILLHDGSSTEPPDQAVVGEVQWFGRVVGNHHLGVGPPRDVDVLKGVNCAYRRDVLVGIGFDRRLRGPGAQVHWELSLGLSLRRAGWRLIYDPAIVVDHFEGERHDVPRVGITKTSRRAVADATFNETTVLLSHLDGWTRMIYLLWSILVGTTAAPGLAQGIRLASRHGGTGVLRWRAATSGRLAALRQRSWAVVPPAPALCPPATLSAIVIAQDEEQRIERCVRSCFKMADEVVVVDGGSVDSTPEIAADLGCRVVRNPWPGYAEQRRVGIAHARSDWVVFVDADEEIGDDLAAAIGDMLRIPTGWDAFRVSRVGDFMGRSMVPEEQVRVCRRSRARVSDVLVHETLDVPAERTGSLPGTLWHHGYRSIEDHVARFDRYTTLEAEEAWRSRKRPNIGRLLLRPPARTVEKLVLRGLWRRGVAGVAVSGFWGFYELLRELKLFEMYRQRGRT